MEKEEGQLIDPVESMDFDLIVVELQKDKKGLRSIAVTKDDLRSLRNMHGKSTSDVVNEIVQLLLDPDQKPTPEGPRV
jgi:hypothetical protein